MPSSPQDMYNAVLRNLREKTGHDAAAWIALVKRAGLTNKSAIREWLKSEHHLGHSTASILANEAVKPVDYRPATTEELLGAQYAGPKTKLRPIYDRLVAIVGELGSEARLEPRETYVSLVRRRQFGLIQPTTRARVDLGLILPGAPATERLLAAGSFGSGRTTHRVALSMVDDVDHQVAAWLRSAFEMDG